MNRTRKRPLTFFLSLIGLFLLAGCTVGPDYRPMALELPEDFKHSGPWKVAEPSDETARGPWWESFDDELLSRLIEDAALGNQDLAAAVARLEQSRALLRISRADELPRLDFNPEAVRSRTPADFARGASLTQTRLAIPFDLSYEIDLWGRIKRGTEADLARYQADVAIFDALHLSLQAEVADRYFAIRALDSQIELLRETLALRQKNLELVKSLFENGRTSRLDLDRAEVELATAEADLQGVLRSRALLENALAVLVGEFPSRFRMESMPLRQTPPEVAPKLPSTLLERRPDVAAAERAMAEANARIGVAEAAFFPRVTLGASAGLASTSLGSLLESDNRTWALGPFATLPLFDGGRNRAGLETAQAALSEAGARYRQQILVAFEETENSLASLTTLKEQRSAQQRAVQSAGRAAELSRTRYSAGLVSYLEVIDSERSALQSRLAQSALLGEQFRATVALIRALGGGWEAPESF